MATEEAITGRPIDEFSASPMDGQDHRNAWFRESASCSSLGPEEAAVVVAETRVGRGVFAVRDFEAGEYVGQVTGELLFDEEHESDYCMDLDDGYVLEPAEPFRFLNHSCDPNAQLVVVAVEDEAGDAVESELWVETLRPIAREEQVTIDYGWPAEGAIPCQCQSANCRGWIVDEEQLDRVRLAK